MVQIKKGRDEKMKRKEGMKKLTAVCCLMLLMTMVLATAACGSAKDKNGTAEGTAVSTESSVLGEGAAEFMFTVVDEDGNESEFEIHTDKETVGEALQELKLIDGEESEYGLYVKTVNGITVDYEADGAYWAFYVNGEYAASGVDTTPVTAGDNYSFKVEK